MSTFEIVRGVEGRCLIMDGTRIAGPKAWGGGQVETTFTTGERYVPERTCTKNEFGFCSECGEQLDDGVSSFIYCSYCGAKVVEE